jgi:hypothetical protein
MGNLDYCCDMGYMIKRLYKWVKKSIKNTINNSKETLNFSSDN